jgi:hypothetical protein
MKKIISTILVCVLLLGCMMSMASCGKMLSGKYEADLLAAKCTYEFAIGGKVTLTVDPILGSTATFEGKYDVNDETKEITFVFESEDAKEYNGTQDFSQGEEDGVKYIKIGLVKYTKVD